MEAFHLLADRCLTKARTVMTASDSTAKMIPTDTHQFQQGLC
jgi:hypothetical protein